MAFGTDASNRMGSLQAIGGTFYNKTIDNSLRMSNDNNTTLQWSAGTPDSTSIWTMSFWIKFWDPEAGQAATEFFSAGTSGSAYSFFALNASEQLTHQTELPGARNKNWNRVIRDTSTWYHFVFRADLNQVATADKLRWYVNGVLETDTSTDGISQSTWSFINASGVTQNWGGKTGIANGNPGADVYLAEINFCDGQSYGPEYFGENKNGVWIPKEPNVTYGANGYRLEFKQTGTGGASASTVGADTSGNDNHFTDSGIGADDILPDSPTNNMAILSAVNKYTNASSNDIREGGLEEGGSGSGYAGTVTFDAEDENGYYFEVTHTGTPGAGCTHGMMNFTDSINQYGGIPGDSDRSGWWGVYRRGAGGSNQFWYYLDGVETATLGVAGAANDVWMYLIKAGKFYIGRNGTWFNSGDPDAGTGFYDSGLTGTDWTIFSGNGINVSGGHKIRVERSLWSHGDDSYKEVKAFNLAEPVNTPRNDSIENSYFYTVLYEGNGGGQRVGQFLPLNEVKTVNNSVRFNDDDSAYMYRTPSASNRKTFTFSAWIKVNPAATNYPPLFNADTSTPDSVIRLGTDGNIEFIAENGGGGNALLITNRKLKDSSVWYHVVCSMDTSNPTADQRLRIYVNGTEETSFSSRTNPDLDDEYKFNSNVIHKIGAQRYASYWDGYMADVHFVDGQALDPTSFGQTDPSTEQWIPKTFTGNHGQNGFHLEFLNNEVGADSANTNSFTPVNLTTANTVIDTPTRNFATKDPNYINSQSQVFSEGNLDVYSTQTSTNPGMVSTQKVRNGKWYWEVYIRAQAGSNIVGIAKHPNNLPSDNYALYNSADMYGWVTAGSIFRNNGTNYSGLVGTWTAGDIIGVALDMDNGDLYMYKNGTAENSGNPVWTGLSGEFSSYSLVYQNGAHTYNFGQDSSFAGNLSPAANTDGLGAEFKYTPPSGYKALNVDNLPAKGTKGIARRKTPVFTWIKNRDSTDSHMLFDQVRGVTKVIHSDPDTHQVETTEVNTLQKFIPGGFQIGNDVQVNTTGESYVAWNWCMHDEIVNAGPQTMSPAGSITATGLADRRLGFSIVKFTGTGANGTVGHGLSQAPEMIMVASLETVSNWIVYHKFDGGTDGRSFLNLNTAGAKFDNGPNSYFQDTPPSSTVISVNGSTYNTIGNDFVYYCFHSVPGYSKIGSYIGNNNADGPFAFCGFKPGFLFLKNTANGATNWLIYDNKRDSYNQMQFPLFASLNNATYTSNLLHVDFLSNGFKIRNGTYGETNGSNQRHIFWAMAESPFKYSNAR